MHDGKPRAVVALEHAYDNALETIPICRPIEPAKVRDHIPHQRPILRHRWSPEQPGREASIVLGAHGTRSTSSTSHVSTGLPGMRTA